MIAPESGAPSVDKGGVGDRKFCEVGESAAKRRGKVGVSATKSQVCEFRRKVMAAKQPSHSRNTVIPQYIGTWKAHSSKFRFICTANRSPLVLAE
jgi:hypothetical protein